MRPPSSNCRPTSFEIIGPACGNSLDGKLLSEICELHSGLSNPTRARGSHRATSSDQHAVSVAVESVSG